MMNTNMCDDNVSHHSLRTNKDSTDFINNAKESTSTTNSHETMENTATERKGTVEPNRSNSFEQLQEFKQRNKKFDKRYSRRSLENTNVRCDNNLDEHSGIFAKRQEHEGSLSISNSPDLNEQILASNASSSNWHDKSDERCSNTPCSAEEKCFVEADKKEKEKEYDRKRDHRQFESERSLPWMRLNPRDKNVSELMFLYLSHKEMMRKIEDLSRRELHACNKHCWDEALRLRDMRNVLELIREKRLYHMDSLEMNEEVRKTGLTNIEQRERELALRENTYMDSNVYSDEAKAIWKKWVYEDDNSVIKNARLQREILMKKLEDDFQSLAVRDKERISKSFYNVIHGSTFQDDLELTASLMKARLLSLCNVKK